MGVQWYSLVQNVQLLGARILLQELARHFPLRCKHDTIVCEDSQRSAGMTDCFQSVFYLFGVNMCFNLW